MDTSTLALHRSLLRLVKGAVTAYEKWVEDQRDDAIADCLKRVRGHSTANDVDMKT